MEENVKKEKASKTKWMILAAVIGIVLIAGILATRKKSGKPAGSGTTTPGQEGAAGGPVAAAIVAKPEQKPDWISPVTGMEFVWVPALGMWVGKYEVTNGEYKKKEEGHKSGDYKGNRMDGERQPVVFVNFQDAKAYAEWLTQGDRKTGKLPAGYAYRLPSEGEWIVFAQCGDGREYPWGKEWPPRSGKAGNYDDETTFDTACIDERYQDGRSVTCNVEESWKNPLGLYGIGGNVWEMAASDPTGLTFGAWRGASWFVSLQVTVSCAYRLDSGGTERRNDYGFRLVLAHPVSK